MKIRTVDAHAGGGSLRLVVEGVPVPSGKTMLDKRDWAIRHLDGLRRALLLEPRGHGAMSGAMLTEPTTSGAHAGVLFMDTGGWRSGYGQAAAVTALALGQRLLIPGGSGRIVVFDTPSGRLTATASGETFEHVSFSGPPSFVLHAGVPIRLPDRLVCADIAFSGAFYAIVDAESVGLSIDTFHTPDLVRRAAEIVRGLDSPGIAAHPLESRLGGLAGVVFTGPASTAAADLRSITVSRHGQANRSPDAAAAAAVMAVLGAMGLLEEGGRFVLEGPVGTSVSGSLTGRTLVGETPAVNTELNETAWMTGGHTFVFQDGDPFREGFVF